MRTLLFFDLPTLTKADNRNYRKFVKEIKKIGFFMLQESVYCKMSIDAQAVKSMTLRLKKVTPPKGSIMMLSVTEKQFADMEILLGENITDVVSTYDRTVIL